jgi:hypothetical protein
MAVFAGTLTYSHAGATVKSFINQVDPTGTTSKTLILQERDGVDSIESEIAAASYTFIRICHLPAGTDVQITGNLIALGNIPAILMTNCIPCNRD